MTPMSSKSTAVAPVVALALRRPYTFIVMALLIQLAPSSPTLPEQSVFDAAVNQLRPQLVTIPGVAIPFPYGGKVRLISVDLNLQELQARGLSPSDVVNALNVQNLILPAGTAKF